MLCDYLFTAAFGVEFFILLYECYILLRKLRVLLIHLLHSLGVLLLHEDHNGASFVSFPFNGDELPELSQFSLGLIKTRVRLVPLVLIPHCVTIFGIDGGKILVDLEIHRLLQIIDSDRVVTSLTLKNSASSYQQIQPPLFGFRLSLWYNKSLLILHAIFTEAPFCLPAKALSFTIVLLYISMGCFEFESSC